MQPDILSQLHDIHTPEPIGWWPLAWGWYLVIAVTLLTLLLTIRALLKAYRFRAAKRQALTWLKTIEANKDQTAPSEQAKQVNEVLKRVALMYSQRRHIAELSGKSWADWLNAQSTKGPIINPEFVSLAYRPECPSDASLEYLTQAKTWVSRCLPLKTSKGSEAAHV